MLDLSARLADSLAGLITCTLFINYKKAFFKKSINILLRRSQIFYLAQVLY
ncbi:hypothetical protein NEOC95_000748 [Neochlamydia sp. AcF95]|nr:hypothetical protein [Neochlamydia sp. AcF95]